MNVLLIMIWAAKQTWIVTTSWMKEASVLCAFVQQKLYWREFEYTREIICWQLFSFIYEIWTRPSVSGRPCCCKASPHTVLYTENFSKNSTKHPCLLCCWTSCVWLCCHSEHKSILPSCIHYLWREWMGFSEVSRHWKGGHAACPLLSMVPAATICGCRLSLLSQAPLRGNCCICIEVNMFKPTPAGQQGVIC